MIPGGTSSIVFGWDKSIDSVQENILSYRTKIIILDDNKVEEEEEHDVVSTTNKEEEHALDEK